MVHGDRETFPAAIHAFAARQPADQLTYTVQVCDATGDQQSIYWPAHN